MPCLADLDAMGTPSMTDLRNGTKITPRSAMSCKKLVNQPDTLLDNQVQLVFQTRLLNHPLVSVSGFVKKGAQ